MLLAVALSGGVDSSVAALRLNDGRRRLVGATHLIWPGSRCCSVEVLSRAEEVCRRLGIPYLQVDLEEEFRRRVVDDFVETYLAGRTPNPCVRCNRFVRFGAFFAALASRLTGLGLLAEGEELELATGHYARTVRTADGWFLAKGRDPVKEQSYMLHQVPADVLPRLVLPLGESLKAEVVREAEAAGLESARVKESQDACFVEGDYAEFLRARTGREDLAGPGDIVDLSGRPLGRHRGVLRYTVGQRSGLGLGNGPWYVARIQPEANRLVVARREQAERSSFAVEGLNWFGEPPGRALECAVKLRYRSREAPCTVEPGAGARYGGSGARYGGSGARYGGESPGRCRVTLRRAQVVTPGQSAVFYRGELVLGGGVILP
jgi:tRNA-specific 2-thiouridylase